LALSHVPRWSIVRRFREQYVGDHTFRVLVIAKELFDYAQVDMPSRIWYAILIHDVDESRTADLPTPAKNLIPGLPEPSRFCPWLRTPGQTPAALVGQERQLVKLADMIESATWIKMHGAGAHAEDVALGMSRAVIAEAQGNSELAMMVSDLMTTITEEEGRFQP